MRRFVLIAILALAGSGVSHAQSEKPLLLRQPTLSKTQIAFIYAGDIWLVSREGGDATRLTSGTGSKAYPRFSPDGSQIAFTADYEGKANVYVVPAAGGVPRRVTYEPGPDLVSGWTNDGKNILFASTRDSSTRGIFRLFTVPVGGGFATALPLPRGWEGSYSEDGSHPRTVPCPCPSEPGPIIVAALLRRSGLPTSPIPGSSASREKIPWTRIRFGSATRFISSPIATEFPQSLPTTRNQKKSPR
jgi:hypothetical protein